MMKSDSFQYRNLVLGIMKAVLAIVVLIFVGRELVLRFAALDVDRLTFRRSDLLFCIVCVMGNRFLSALSYRNLVLGFGSRMAWKSACVVSWVPAPAKYIPGKIVGLAGAIYLFKSYGISTRIAASVMVLHVGLTVLIGFVVVLVGSIWTPFVSLSSPLGGAVAGSALIGIAALHPRILAALLRHLPGHCDKDYDFPELGHYAITIAIVLIQWVLGGIALWLCLRSVHPVSTQVLPIVITSSALAMVAGVLAVFAPGGLGVREGILLLALDPYAPSVAIAVAVVSIRLVQVLADVILAAIGVVALPKKSTPASGRKTRDEVSNEASDICVISDKPPRV